MSAAGWVQAYGACLTCGRHFYFNPHRVPSFPDPKTGEREPVCPTCMEIVNRVRESHGLDPHPILDGAYEPMPAEQL